jgi:NAD(P)-dependent dehydrogenase (short-subunit alcohol dehydrogenase family)
VGQLDGKVAIVTGAGQNIGRAIALRFAAEGATVAVVDRDRGRAEAVTAENEAAGGRAMAVVADVSDEDDVSRGVDDVVRVLGDVHLLVNNAAATINKTLLETSLDEWEYVIGVTLRSQFLFIRKVAAAMILAGHGGAIVNMASTSGHRGNVGKGAYPVAKGGVLNLTRVAAVELAPHGIRVNSVTPTQSGQPLGYGYQEDVFERSGPARSIPLGRWGRPEDQANAALFLASDQSEFITGADLPCDGGLLAVFPKAL